MVIIDLRWLEVEIGVSLIDDKFFIVLGYESGWSFAFGSNEAFRAIASYVFIIERAGAAIATVTFYVFVS